RSPENAAKALARSPSWAGESEAVAFLRRVLVGKAFGFFALVLSLGGSISCVAEGTPEPLTGLCDASCVLARTLLVSSARGSCGGVVWSERTKTYVLTAAYCARGTVVVLSPSGEMK